jgi:hypothetical protein
VTAADPPNIMTMEATIMVLTLSRLAFGWMVVQIETTNRMRCPTIATADQSEPSRSGDVDRQPCGNPGHHADVDESPDELQRGGVICG